MSTPQVLLSPNANLAVVQGVAPLTGGSSTQTTWFIDPVGGSDSNTGLTSVTALQTDAERQRRVGTIWNIIADTSVTYLNNVPSTDPCIYNVIFGTNGVLRIKGTPTVAYTSPGGGFTAVTNMNRATQTPSSVTEVGLGAGRTGQRIRTTSGANTNSIAWLDKDLGGGAYRTSPWGIMNLAASPIPATPTPTTVAVGNQFVVENLTQLGYITINNLSAQFGGALTANGSQIVFSDVYCTQADVIISILPLGTVTSSPLFYGCRVHTPLNATMCQVYLDTGAIFAASSSTVALLACLVRGRPTSQNGCVMFVDYDTLFSQSGSNGFRVRYGGVVRLGSAAVFDAASDAVLVEDGDVRCDAFLSGADLLWGNANGGVGVRTRTGGKFTFNATPSVTGAGSDAIVGGTAAVTWATIVAASQSSIMNANNGAIVGKFS